MNFQRTAIGLATVVLFSCGAAQARPLSDELGRLIQEHPLIKSAHKSTESGQFGVEAARAGFMPRLNIVGDHGPESLTNTSYNGAGQKITSSTARAKPIESELTRNRLATTLEQNLYSGGRTQAQVNVAKTELEALQNGYRSTVQNTLLEGILAYLQVARFQTLIAISKRNEETTQQQLNLEDERVTRGGGIAVDVLQAKTRLQIAKERRVFNEQSLRDALATYRQVFGSDPVLSMMQDVDVPKAQTPASLEAAFELAKELNPSLKEALLQSQKALKQLSAEKAAFMPSIDLVGTLAKENNASQLAEKDEKSILLKMNWNLFSGGETLSRSAAAEKNYESLIERETATVRKVEESVRIAWHQLVNGQERQELLENAANISFEVMRNRKKLRDAGKESAINVLDAEVEYFGVLANRVNAMYDTRIGGFRLLAATGRLTPEVLGLDGETTPVIPVKPLDLNIETVIR